MRGWWSENIEGKTDEANSEFTHRDRYLLVTFKITYLTPQKMVGKVEFAIRIGESTFLHDCGKTDGF